jgi:predicted regulator of Ras-like GTPase activity (Roadblock/LC7/MglB family)
MEDILRGLKDLPGVRGSFVCDATGVVVSAQVPTGYADEFENLGREVVLVTGLLQRLGEETEIIDFLFSDGRILVSGFKDFSLVVFCEPNVDSSMVRLRSSVTVDEFTRDGRFRKHIRKVSKARERGYAVGGLSEPYKGIMKKAKPV